MAGRGRGAGGDPDFGSDSFLDIIANLVGILIIMIVLAGLRASQAPLQPDELPASADAIDAEPRPEQPAMEPTVDDPPPPVAVAETPLSVESEPEPTIAPEPPLAVIADVEPAPLPEPPPFAGLTIEDAAAQLAALQQQLKDAEARLAAVDVASAWDQTRTLQAQLARQAAKLRSLQSDVARQGFLAEQDVRQAREASAEATRLRRRLEDVNRQLEQLSESEPQTERLQIRINPIGRRSTGDELFFVIENQRVLRIPVRELFELAAGRERSNTALILRAETQRGVVGPVDGVTYDYEIGMQVQPVSSSSRSVSYTNSLVMHGVMHPSAAAIREPVDEALAEGGILSRTLLQADRGAVIRLSVATDSFAHARRIAAYCRDLGFPVSMNTMEPGEEIRVRFGSGSDAVAQ